ncbi:predicted protein [Coccidioides posadasii str. Silveira]|uniref:Predicted protein n=2 Tax=Coccidioides posadasii TaxID=199306 RepID=E9D4H0_COCPS|nr:predicted protein [Coccidioides posadasii str. Silveira]KMM71304.1 hypothetical protein CPAG_07611 [Coccidioides posadasii RMSCC 3488]
MQEKPHLEAGQGISYRRGERGSPRRPPGNGGFAAPTSAYHSGLVNLVQAKITDNPCRLSLRMHAHFRRHPRDPYGAFIPKRKPMRRGIHRRMLPSTDERYDEVVRIEGNIVSPGARHRAAGIIRVRFVKPPWHHPTVNLAARTFQGGTMRMSLSAFSKSKRHRHPSGKGRKLVERPCSNLGRLEKGSLHRADDWAAGSRRQGWAGPYLMAGLVIA